LPFAFLLLPSPVVLPTKFVVKLLAAAEATEVIAGFFGRH